MSSLFMFRGTRNEAKVGGSLVWRKSVRVKLGLEL